MKQLAIVVTLLAFGVSVFAQGTPAPTPASKTPATAPQAAPASKGAKTKEGKIQNAVSAAPRSIAKDATIMEPVNKNETAGS